MLLRKSCALSTREIMRLAAQIREDINDTTHPYTQAVQRDIERVAATERLSGQDLALRINARS